MSNNCFDKILSCSQKSGAPLTYTQAEFWASKYIEGRNRAGIDSFIQETDWAKVQKELAYITTISFYAAPKSNNFDMTKGEIWYAFQTYEEAKNYFRLIFDIIDDFCLYDQNVLAFINVFGDDDDCLLTDYQGICVDDSKGPLFKFEKTITVAQNKYDEIKQFLQNGYNENEYPDIEDIDIFTAQFPDNTAIRVSLFFDEGSCWCDVEWQANDGLCAVDLDDSKYQFGDDIKFEEKDVLYIIHIKTTTE